MYVTLRSVPKSSDEVASTSVLRRRRIPSAVLAFGVVSMLTDVSSESVAAVLPLYITAVLGMGPLAYGFIDGIYQGVSAAVRILGGWWSDSTKRPKWVAFVGYLASAMSRIGLLLATGFASITAVIAVDRLGKGLRTGPRDSLIATASDPADLGRNFGVHRAMDTAGALPARCWHSPCWLRSRSASAAIVRSSSSVWRSPCWEWWCWRLPFLT